MAYELDNTAVLVAWMDRAQDSVSAGRVLEWVAVLLDNPGGVEAVEVPGHRLQRAAVVPGTDVVVTFVVADEFQTVRLISVTAASELL
ncbi:MAG: hypothetical protein ACRDZ3_20795 [Acidimicrobiia bacterium]